MKRTVVLLIIAVFILTSCVTNDPRHSGSDITTTANITTSEDPSLQGDLTDGKAAGTSESTNAADDITDDPIRNPDQIDVTSLSGYKAFITGFEGTLGTKFPFNLISEFEYPVGIKSERVVLDGDDIEKEIKLFREDITYLRRDIKIGTVTLDDRLENIYLRLCKNLDKLREIKEKFYIKNSLPLNEEEVHISEGRVPHIEYPSEISPDDLSEVSAEISDNDYKE